MIKRTEWVMVAVGLLTASIATAQTSGTFTLTGNMSAARSQHTATLLPNGKVLIAGGVQSSRGSPLIVATTELYDPDTGTFSRAADMRTGRRMHTSALLPDGRVLIAGGFGAGTASDWGTASASAELYDPSAGTFTPTGDMTTPRGWPTAILLSTGKVLVVGNGTSAELYDPASGTFTATGEYVGRGGCDFCAPATLLADGTVLFPGQYPAQIYDPVRNTFRVAGMMVSEESGGPCRSAVLMVRRLPV
jgi:hypothetical protein